MVWEPKSCCGCGSVKTGTLVLGWLALVFSTLHVLGSLRYTALDYSDYKDICVEVIKEQDLHDLSPDTCARTVISSIVVSAVTSTISVIISILLLVGVNKSKPVLMLPFMICQVIGITFLGLAGLILFGVLLYIGAIGAAFFIAILIGLIMFLEVYFFLVIRICYKEVKQHASGMGYESSIPYVEQVSFPYKN